MKTLTTLAWVWIAVSLVAASVVAPVNLLAAASLMSSAATTYMLLTDE